MRIALWLAFTSLCFSAFAGAQQGDDKALSLLFIENPPHVRAMQGKPSGPYVDYILSIMQSLSQPYQVKLVPIKRAIAEAELGHGIAIGVLKIPEREQKLDFSSPTNSTDLVFAIAKERPQAFNSERDLKGKVIATSFGWSYGARFDLLRDKQYFDTVSGDLELNIKQLLLGRADYVIATYSSLAYTLKRHDLEGKIQILDRPWADIPVYIAVAKGQHRVFLDAFSATVEQVKKERPYSHFLHQSY